MEIFFEKSGFKFRDSRRNLFVKDVELMHCIGKEFQIGTARFFGVKYCVPCNRPSKLVGAESNFKDAFLDRGGLIAQVVHGGVIEVGCEIITPDGY